jgi:hypothetical protein
MYDAPPHRPTQANFPLKVSLLDEESWDWSLRRLVERQRVYLGLDLGAELSIACALCPASLPLQPAHDLEACNCHSAILSPPPLLSVAMQPAASEVAGPKRCPCSKLALDKQDLSKVTAVGPLVWPGLLAYFTQGGHEAPPRNFAPWAPPVYPGLESPHGDSQSWHASLEALNRIPLKSLPLISLRGDPWILSADDTSMNAQPGVLSSLARQLHESKQGLVCALRGRDAFRDEGRYGWMARSLAGLSRVILLPQGPPHTILLLKALSTTPQLTHASSAEAELGTNASAGDPHEEALVAVALQGLDTSDELCASEWWHAEEGAAVVARCLSTVATHPVAAAAPAAAWQGAGGQGGHNSFMAASAVAWQGAGGQGGQRAQPAATTAAWQAAGGQGGQRAPPAPRGPSTPPCCGPFASEGCYDDTMQPWTTQRRPATEEQYFHGVAPPPPAMDSATRAGLGRTSGGGGPTPGAAAKNSGASRSRPAVKRKMQRIPMSDGPPHT